MNRSIIAIGLLAYGVMAYGVMGCSTLAEHDPAAGDLNAPNAALGPFREIRQIELGESRLAPLVLSDDETLIRDVTLLDTDGDPGTLGSVAYAARLDPDGMLLGDPAAPAEQIVRVEVSDGRSFPRLAQLVLTPELPWEGGTVGAPAAVRNGGEIWLYYQGAGGIGLATSADGVSFVRSGDAPVLAPQPGGWEAGAAVSSPAVVRRADGSFRMLYAVAASGERPAAIGEALSANGIDWTRTGEAPALPLSDGDPLDAAGASAPCLVPMTSPEGRASEQLYYLATQADGATRVALAGRFIEQTAFTRATSPVYGDDNTPLRGEPWVMRYDSFSILFVSQLTDADGGHPAVAAGIAPATAALAP